MLNLQFDHSISIIDSLSEYTRFKELGFSIGTKPNEHDKCLNCYYLMFDNKKALEFVHVYDDKIFLETELYQINKYNSAVAFGIKESLEIFYNTLAKENQNSNFDFSHKNYHPHMYVKERHPGWNFLKVNDFLIPNTNMWFIEYEPRPVKTEYNTNHKNTVYAVDGVLWTIKNKKEIRHLEKYFGAFNNKTKKEYNLYFEIENSNTYLSNFYSKKKTTSLSAVVLKCRNLEKFCKISKLKSDFDFYGQKSVLIELNNKSFDIIITQGE